MWLPPKYIDRWAITDVDIIMKPLDITYNEDNFPKKDLPILGEPYVAINFTHYPAPLKKMLGYEYIALWFFTIAVFFSFYE